jgi:hypothetical protein
MSIREKLIMCQEDFKNKLLTKRQFWARMQDVQVPKVTDFSECLIDHAEVAELVDALDSGSSGE